MYSSYMCLIYSRMCFLRKSDLRKYHIEGFPMGYELGDPEFDGFPMDGFPRDTEFESYMAGKRYMDETRDSKRKVISYMIEKRNADDTHENVEKKRCTEGSESL